jgi:hypothetical protein
VTTRAAIGLDTAKRLAAAFRTTPQTDSYETRLWLAAGRASRGSSVVYQDWHVAQAIVLEEAHWAAERAAETERKLRAQLEEANRKLMAAATEMTREAQARALAKAG